ncbi:MAG: hypothetical protein LBB75_02090 [Oscillospiraceae bacterium]|nr:hypothetical protein [Oscillospiraceae bacterium]
MTPNKKHVISKAREKQQALDLNVAAVVEVKSFDKDKMTVDVQPLSKRLVQGKYQSCPPVQAVPIAVTRCADWVVRPWYKKGDVGLLVYIDHDIDKVADDGKESEPNTERNHSASDAVFVGGIVLGQKNIAQLAQNDCPDEALALGSVDGKQWIAICKDKIKSQADKWEHKGDIEIKGDIDIEGDVKIKGDVSVTGKIDATDEIHSDTDVTAVNISLKNHVHMVNLGNAGGPVVGPTNPPG